MKVSYFRGSDILNIGLTSSEVFSSITESNEELANVRFYFFRTMVKGVLVAIDDDFESNGVVLFLIDILDKSELKTIEDDLAKSQVIEHFLDSNKVDLLRQILGFLIKEKDTPKALNDATFLSMLYHVPKECFIDLGKFSDLNLVKLSILNSISHVYDEMSLDEILDRSRLFNEFVI